MKNEIIVKLSFSIPYCRFLFLLAHPDIDDFFLISQWRKKKQTMQKYTSIYIYYKLYSHILLVVFKLPLYKNTKREESKMRGKKRIQAYEKKVGKHTQNYKIYFFYFGIFSIQKLKILRQIQARNKKKKKSILQIDGAL